jgi:phosphate transport system permease protein
MTKTLGTFFAIIGFGLPFLIIFFLFKESHEAISQYGIQKFLTDSSWYPNENLVGLSAQIKGSLSVALLSLAFAIPSAISFVFMNEFLIPKKLSLPINLMIDTIAGIPSVVFGLWALVKVVPFLAKNHPPGTSLLMGGIVLSMMIFPGLVVGIRGLLQTFSHHYAFTATSLNISPYSYFFSIFMGSNISGMLGIIILQFGRSLGETMAVLMVTGNVSQDPDSIFSPIRTLTSNIALEMAYANGGHRSSLFMSGLILACVLFVCSLIVLALRRESHD